MFRSGYYLAISTIMSACVAYAATSSNSEIFVQNLGKKAIDTLTSGSLSDDEIKSQFRSILEEGFAVTNIAKFVMGANWRKLDAGQQEQFRSIFAKRLENAYAARFREYKGVAFAVKGSRQEGDGGIVVNSTIQKPGGPIVNVDWKIYNANGGEKIFDVTVDGVSMSITLRSDYNSAFQSKGGDVGTFLKDLSQ